MSVSPYVYTDYKAFFLQRIQDFPGNGRGVRRRLAEAIGCQVAYVSHVLAAEKHFSLEQGEAAARFFGLREEESEFLLLLIEHARAGTEGLKRNLFRQIERRRNENREIQKRIRVSDTISPEDQAEYYSSWHYQAIKTLLMIPGFQDPHEIATRLNIPVTRVSEVLGFLTERGLVKETRSGFEVTAKQIHLPRTSPLISKLHSNWRIRTLSSLENLRPDDYHYSGVVTLSREDAQRVREILVKSLQEAAEVIKPSKEETICVLAMDFFEL